MKLLISANSFYPNVGGYERVALQIAEHLHARGMIVRVVTFTAEKGTEKFPFEVFRNPDALTFLGLVKWSNIYMQNNVSLKLLWPMLFVRRPLLFVHHGFYQAPDGLSSSWQSRIKNLVTHLGGNIAVSSAVAASIPAKAQVCLNPYRDDVFYRIPSILKDRDLFFVGRLVSNKGVDLLIDAVAALRKNGIEASLTIAGSGPEEEVLKRMTRDLALTNAITFVGQVRDEKLNELLNAHKILVVPTRKGEGFGVVALEGIACGCVVVGSSDGGLRDAIGPCGRVFPKGDSAALAEMLRDLLTNPGVWEQYLSHSESHLDSHRPAVVVDRYVRVIDQIVDSPLK